MAAGQPRQSERSPFSTATVSVAWEEIFRGHPAAYDSHAAILTKWGEVVGANLVVREAEYVDRSFLAVYGDQYARTFSPQERFCIRYVFFRVPAKRVSFLCRLPVLEAIDWLYARSDRSPVILGAIVRRPIDRFLGRCYLRLPSTAQLTRIGEWPTPLQSITIDKTISLAGRPFEIGRCIPFTSQDGYAAACASVAIWTALEMMTAGRDVALSPTAITRAALRRNAGHGLFARGLDVAQMTAALRELGFQPLVAAPRSHITWELLLTWMLDSNIPPVVGLDVLPAKRGDAPQPHAIALSGLADNADDSRQGRSRWGERGRQFLAIDDAIGPFVKMSFLEGHRRSQLESLHEDYFGKTASDPAGLVELTTPTLTRRAVIHTLVAAIPPAIEPIRQDLAQEAPEFAWASAAAVVNFYGPVYRQLMGAGAFGRLRRAYSVFRGSTATGFEIPTIAKGQTGGNHKAERALGNALFSTIPIFLRGSADCEEHLGLNYHSRSYLVRSSALKKWLAADQVGWGRPRRLVDRFRLQPMPEYVYLLELRRRGVHATCGQPKHQGRRHVHGEIVTDPSGPDGRLLFAWFEGLMVTPRVTKRPVSRTAGVASRLTSQMVAHSIGATDQDAGVVGCVLSWLSNSERNAPL